LGFGFSWWRNYSVRRRLCYWVLLEHIWIQNEVVPYFPTDNAHLMYTTHPVLFSSRERVWIPHTWKYIACNTSISVS
jgi:hypothetical protein